MGIFTVYLRRSSTLIAGLLVGSISVLVALTSRRDGLDLWPDLMTGLSQASIFNGVLASGLCALESSRWISPARYRSLATVRPFVLSRVIHASAVIIPVLIGYCVGILYLYLTGVAVDRYGTPHLPWIFALLSALLLASTFGYVLGIFIGKKWYAAPLAAVSFLSFYIASRIVFLPYGFKSLFPIITNTDSVFVRYISSTMYGQIFLFVGLSVALIVIVGLGWDGLAKTTSIISAASVLLALVGGSIVVGTNGQYVTGFNHRDFTCGGTSVEICVNVGYADTLPPLIEQFELLNEKAAGTSMVARHLEQNVEGVGDAPSENARSIYLEENNEFGILFSAARYVSKYGGLHSCNEGDFESLVSVGIVNAWLSGYDELGISSFGDNGPGVLEFEKFSDVSVMEGNAWLRNHEDDYLNCSLLFSDFNSL